jgi:ribonuclease-3
VMEAIFGAAYLDSGYDAAKQLILRLLGPVPQKAIHYAKDPKTELQEIFQAACSVAPTYAVVQVSGSGHAPVFEVEVTVGEHPLARGEGANKKEAAQEAAKRALVHVQTLDKQALEALARRRETK